MIEDKPHPPEPASSDAFHCLYLAVIYVRARYIPPVAVLPSFACCEYISALAGSLSAADTLMAFWQDPMFTYKVISKAWLLDVCPEACSPAAHIVTNKTTVLIIVRANLFHISTAPRSSTRASAVYDANLKGVRTDQRPSEVTVLYVAFSLRLSLSTCPYRGYEHRPVPQVGLSFGLCVKSCD